MIAHKWFDKTKIIDFGGCQNNNNLKTYIKEVKGKSIIQAFKKLGFDTSLYNINFSRGCVKFNSFSKEEIILKKSWINYTKGKNGKYPIGNVDNALIKAVTAKYGTTSTSSNIEKHDLDPSLNETFCLANSLIALPQRENSKVLYFDIDLENGMEYFHKLKKDFNDAKEMLVEVSPLGRVHAAWRTNKKLSQKDLILIEQNINEKYETNGKIELRSFSQVMRLPSSYQYKTLNSNGKEFYENEDWIYPILKRKYSTVNVDTLIVDKQSSIECTKQVPIGLRKKKIKSSIDTIEEKKYKLFTGFPFGDGTRYRTTFKIVSRALYCGFDENIAHEAVLANNNGTSKDLAKWTPAESFNYTLGVYQMMQKNFNPQNTSQAYNYDPDKFISNLPLLEGIEIPDDLFELMYQELFRKRIISRKAKDWVKEEYKRALSLLFKEMLGKLIYENKNPREINSESKMFSFKFKQTQIGVTFPVEKYLRKMKKHYGIKIDIRRLFKFLSNHTLFSQYNHNGLGWCFNSLFSYCKQYVLKYTDKEIDTNNIEDLINININTYYNSLVEKKKRYNNHICQVLPIRVLSSIGFFLNNPPLVYSGFT
jgi:hypothetical protein